ncbi:MAG TPA: hypothetical protein VKS20_12570 [Candidatus Acidoferrales bacterium]|nr:hypothetical protein [Candidatus Acidoferrales bacterium]
MSAGQLFDVTNYTYTFGSVLSPWASKRLSPFGEMLLGRFHEDLPGASPIVSFAFLSGGGLDFKVHQRLALRVFELDYLHMHSTTLYPVGTNNLRLSAGIVFQF